MFREVSMAEVREVLRLCQLGYGLRRTADVLGMDRKTVSRHLPQGLTSRPFPPSPTGAWGDLSGRRRANSSGGSAWRSAG